MYSCSLLFAQYVPLSNMFLPFICPGFLPFMLVCARTDQILYGAVSLDEKKQITPVVYSNTIMSMKVLVEQATLLGEEVCFNYVLFLWYDSMISIARAMRSTFGSIIF